MPYETLDDLIGPLMASQKDDLAKASSYRDMGIQGLMASRNQGPDWGQVVSTAIAAALPALTGSLMGGRGMEQGFAMGGKSALLADEAYTAKRKEQTALDQMLAKLRLEQADALEKQAKETGKEVTRTKIKGVEMSATKDYHDAQLKQGDKRLGLEGQRVGLSAASNAETARHNKALEAEKGAASTPLAPVAASAIKSLYSGTPFAQLSPEEQDALVTAPNALDALAKMGRGMNPLNVDADRDADRERKIREFGEKAARHIVDFDAQRAERERDREFRARESSLARDAADKRQDKSIESQKQRLDATLAARNASKIPQTGADPKFDAAWDKVLNGAPLAPEDNAAIRRAGETHPGVYELKSKIEYGHTAGGYLAQKEARFKREVAEKDTIHGTEWLRADTPPAPLRPAENERLQKVVDGFSRAKAATDRLEELYEKNGGYAFFNLDAAAEGAFSSILFSAGRILGETGATLSAGEREVIEEVSSKAATQEGVLPVLAEWVQRNPAERIKIVRSAWEHVTNAQLGLSGRKLKGTAGVDISPGAGIDIDAELDAGL